MVEDCMSTVTVLAVALVTGEEIHSEIILQSEECCQQLAGLRLFQLSSIVSCLGSSPNVKIIALALASCPAVWVTLITYWGVGGGAGEDVDLSGGAHGTSSGSGWVRLSAAVIGKLHCSPGC